MDSKEGFKQEKYGFIKSKDLAPIQWKTGFDLMGNFLRLRIKLTSIQDETRIN